MRLGERKPYFSPTLSLLPRKKKPSRLCNSRLNPINLLLNLSNISSKPKSPNQIARTHTIDHPPIIRVLKNAQITSSFWDPPLPNPHHIVPLAPNIQVVWWSSGFRRRDVTHKCCCLNIVKRCMCPALELRCCWLTFFMSRPYHPAYPAKVIRKGGDLFKSMIMAPSIYVHDCWEFVLIVPWQLAYTAMQHKFRCAKAAKAKDRPQMCMEIDIHVWGSAGASTPFGLAN